MFSYHLWNWKTEGIKETEEKKTWIKNIKNNRRTVEGNAQIDAGLCFHKIKIEKKGKKKPFCSNQPISIKSVENWQTF